MSALTTIFNFLYVYIRLFFAVIFGGKVYLSSFSGDSYYIAKSIFDTFGASSQLVFRGYPIFMLIICIFAVGAIIGLARRLMR